MATALAATTESIARLGIFSEGEMPDDAILVHAPSAAFQAPGGGEVQLARTTVALESLGLPVRPFNPWIDQLEEARALHLFGMSTEGLALAKIAKAKRIPVILSPICWFEPSALCALAPSRFRAVRDLGAWMLRRAFPKVQSWRRSLFELADAVLPNSKAEAVQLIRLFRLDPKKIHIVPNGVAPHFEFADPEPFRTTIDASHFVLFAGRVEPRKNLLGLIRATRVAELPLVVIGDPVPGCEDYAKKCVAEGTGHVKWHPRIEPDDPMLASAYAAARVFAMPSWFETPSLAALEAALAGAGIVITPYGCTKEYFGDYVSYARPGHEQELVSALRRQFGFGGAPTELVEEIKERYLWSTVARTTAEVYDEVAPS